MIDVLANDNLDLGQAAELLSKDRSCVWKWCIHGQRGVYLEHARLGNKIVTNREALNAFFNKLATAYQVETEATERTQRRRRTEEADKAHDDAMHELAADGLL